MTTSQVCEQLGIRFYVIAHVIRAGRLQRPTKNASGDYCWSTEDVERLRQVLAQRRKAVPA